MSRTVALGGAIFLIYLLCRLSWFEPYSRKAQGILRGAPGRLDQLWLVDQRLLRPATPGSRTQGLDESRKRGWLLLPTRIVKEEAGERRTPILEDAHQISAREVIGNAVFRHPGETHPIDDISTNQGRLNC